MKIRRSLVRTSCITRAAGKTRLLRTTSRSEGSLATGRALDLFRLACLAPASAAAHALRRFVLGSQHTANPEFGLVRHMRVKDKRLEAKKIREARLFLNNEVMLQNV
jgi:hypothetical protein